jgi:hypothetical protein
MFPQLGHAFGLAHTDENFYNSNLGNCLDYTNRPETNQKPDESNFKSLQQLYGDVPMATTEAPISVSMPAPTFQPSMRRPTIEQSSYWDEDPFNSREDAVPWRTSGNGLTIEIINALDDEWQELFDLVVEDWDNGTPDALTLATNRVATDPQCTPVAGKIKLCNGNYGATNWRSINKILLENGWIYGSTARINEFYLGNETSEAQRRYSLCHEVRSY